MLKTANVSFLGSQRNISWPRLLFNSATFTRGASKVCAAIWGIGVLGDVDLLVKPDGLYTEKENIPIVASNYYAKNLYKAGILKITFSKGTEQKQIKKILDILCDQPSRKYQESLVQQGVLFSPVIMPKNIVASTGEGSYESEDRGMGDYGEGGGSTSSGYSGGSDSVGGAMGGEDSYGASEGSGGDSSGGYDGGGDSDGNSGGGFSDGGCFSG